MLSTLPPDGVMSIPGDCRELDFPRVCSIGLKRSSTKVRKMKVTIEIPDTMMQTLYDQLGQDLEGSKESLAIAWYQSEKISIGQVAEMLGMSVYQAEGMMKEHHVALLYSIPRITRTDQRNV